MNRTGDPGATAFRRLSPYDQSPGLLDQVLQAPCWTGLAHARLPAGSGHAGAESLARETASSSAQGPALSQKINPAH